MSKKIKFLLVLTIAVCALTAFAWQSDLTYAASVTTPDGIVFETSTGTITDYTGAGGDLVIPDTIEGVSVTTIGRRAFDNSGLTSVTVPEGVTLIDSFAFDGNSITSVTLPTGLKTIEEGAFIDNLLTQVTLPSTIRYVAFEAFRGNSIASFTLPTINDAGFYGWYTNYGGSVTNGGTVSDLIAGYIAVYEYTLTDADVVVTNGIIESYNFCGTGYAGGMHPMHITIPTTLDSQTVTGIGEDIFWSQQLVYASLPDTIEYIGVTALANNFLREINLPSSLVELGDKSFWLNRLTSVTIPNGVTTIGTNAFYSNGLTSVTLPESVIEIGASAFENNLLSSFVLPSNTETDFIHWIDNDSGTTYSGGATVTDLTHSFTAMFNVPVTGVALTPETAECFVGRTVQLTATVLPSDATNKNITYSSNNETIATVDSAGLVTAHSEGTAVITAATVDGGHNAICTVEVYLSPVVSAASTSINGLENLGFTPFDVVYDPVIQVAYATEADGNKAYRIDLITGEVRYLEFMYRAQHLAIGSGELYVSLGRINDYKGHIVAISTDTFTVSHYIDTTGIPHDIVLDTQDNLYIIQDTATDKLVSYDTNTWTKLGNYNWCPSHEKWVYNEKYNKLYTVKTAGSPDEIYACEITTGVVTNCYGSPYHGDYELGQMLTISPDGNYIFNELGNIFSCQPTQSGDMVYYNNIDQYSALCFDEYNNKFYTGYGKILKEYNLDTQSFATSHMVEDEIHELHYKYGQINAIQINSSGHYYFSTITAADYINPYVQTATYSGNALSDIGFVPQDIAIDTASGMAYMTAIGDNKLYQANLTTGQMQYMEFIYPAESITIGNGKVYVSLLHQPHQYSISTENIGTVAVIATDTFTFNNHFVVEADPYDIEVDNQGIVYIGPGSGQWSYSLSYDSITGEKLSQCIPVYYLSLLDYNQQYQKLYSITQGLSPRDITAYETSNGVITSMYNSPYHGDYPMSADISVSPDGQYIFNGSGNIFTCAPTSAGDMVYSGNVDAFSSICYDLNNNKFFTSQDNVLKVYAYDSRTITKQYTDENNFVKIFYWVDKLIALKINNAGVYYIDTATGTGINTTGVSIDGGEVNVGGTLQLVPTVTPSEATNKTVLYSSSDNNIATVDSSGLVTGVSFGTVTITATTQDGGFTDTCTINVNQPVTGVTLLPESSHCWVSKTIQLTHAISPLDAENQEITYTSSNEAVATVDAEGVVTGVSAGTAVITVETSDGGFTDTCTVTVDNMIANDKVAVIFGMADYVGVENDLNGPDHDMIGMKAVLEHAGYTVFMHMNYGAANLLDEVERVTQGISPETTLLFAYAGHGADGGYLVGADGYGISIEDLESRLSLHPGVKEVLIDACFSGDFIARGIEVRSITPINSQEEFNNYIISVFKDSETNFAARSLDETGYYVMTASSGDQYAHAKMFSIPNSPFAAANYTPVVIDGQNYYWLGHFSSSFHLGYGLYNDTPFTTAYADLNSDNYITWHEMFTYIANRVADTQNAQVYPENSSHIIGRATGGSITSVTGVTIQEKAQLDAGATLQLTAEVQPAEASHTAVTFSSDNESVATVDAVGMVWAHALGTATITVTTEDGGHTDTCIVTVGQPVTGVTLSPEKASMLAADTLQLTATVAPENAGNTTVTYSSDNEAVATVDAAGLVTSHTTGTAVITVTTEDGEFTDTCTVTVADELITSDIYTVNRLQTYLEDIPIGATAQQVIDAITTSSGEIRILDADRQQITGDVLVSTTYYVQLVVDGEVVDELVIAIKGDVNPDTVLNIMDYTLIRLHILELEELTGIALDVADVNDDGVINIMDYTLIRLHILELESLYE